MKKNTLLLALVLIAAAGWKFLLLCMEVVPFNADEAVVGLMARHILAGERPIFFYGQSYMGSLDAVFVALGFAILGQGVWVIRLVQIILYLFVLLTTARLGQEVNGSQGVGVLAAGLLAIPAVNVSLYTTVSLGGYLEALLIGNITLLAALRLARGPNLAAALLWGFTAGLGLWANALTLVYSLPALIYLVTRLWRRAPSLPMLRLLGGAAAGGLAGSLPWWIYALQNGLQNLTGELTGSAVAVEQAGWLARTGIHLVNLLLLGFTALFGFRPPWSVTWLALPLLPFALAAWGIVLAGAYHRLRQPGDARAEYALLGGVGLVLFAGFLFTSFGVDPSGRYFLPISVMLAVFAADFAVRSGAKRWLRFAVPAVLMLYQFGGNLQSALTYPPGFTTQFDSSTVIDHRYDQELLSFLKAHGETRGYTTYWVAYPLAFLSNEEIIFTPRLPYHSDLRYTARDNRYSPYEAAVSAAARTAFITARNPALDERITAGLRRLGVSWQEAEIGDYHVYYALPAAVRPEDLGLGEAIE